MKLILLLVFAGVGSGSCFGQPGDNPVLFLHVFNEKKEPVLFNTAENQNKIVARYPDKLRKKRLYSGTIHSEAGSVFGPVSIPGRPETIVIRHNSDKMVIHFSNYPENKTFNLLIDTLIFTPGIFNIDCEKTKNSGVEHPFFGPCVDITPSNNWYKKDNE